MKLPALAQDMVRSAMHEAEEHTARYYCFPPHKWEKIPYDLLTLSDRGWSPLPHGILAELSHIKEWSRGRSAPFDFYRIQLNDPGILGMSLRENLQEHLYSFLVFILTHEMVHMVRLSSILEGVESHPHWIAAEEERVDRISRHILSAAEQRVFAPVLSKLAL